MPRGPRSNRAARTTATPERAARRIERKVAKVMEATHGGYAGPSIIETLEGKLLGACVRYLTVKHSHDDMDGDLEEEHTLPQWVDVAQKRGTEIGTARGIVRGMAEGVATMRNPYVADRRAIIKTIEREFMRKARLTMSGQAE